VNRNRAFVGTLKIILNNLNTMSSSSYRSSNLYRAKLFASKANPWERRETSRANRVFRGYYTRTRDTITYTCEMYTAGTIVIFFGQRCFRLYKYDVWRDQSYVASGNVNRFTRPSSVTGGSTGRRRTVKSRTRTHTTRRRDKRPFLF